MAQQDKQYSRDIDRVFATHLGLFEQRDRAIIRRDVDHAGERGHLTKGDRVEVFHRVEIDDPRFWPSAISSGSMAMPVPGTRHPLHINGPHVEALEHDDALAALADLNLHRGDCSMLFNAENTTGFRDALPKSAAPGRDLARADHFQGGRRLCLLGSEEPLDDNTQFTVSAIDALLSVLRSQFHYVVVDVPQISGAAFRRAPEMADRRVIVVNPCSSCFNLQFTGL